jgi:hypothetical protein
MNAAGNFSVDYLTTRFQYQIYIASDGVIDKWWIWKDLEKSGRNLVKVLSRHVPGGTEENNEKPHWGYPVWRPRFEPSTSRV